MGLSKTDKMYKVGILPAPVYDKYAGLFQQPLERGFWPAPTEPGATISCLTKNTNKISS